MQLDHHARRIDRWLLSTPVRRRWTCRVLRWLAPPVLNCDGARVVADRTDQVVFPRLALGIFERGESRFLRRQLRPGCAFIDVGANCGYYTALALRHGAQVLAFEPERENFRLLTCTAGSNLGRAQLFNVALGADDRSTDLYLHPYNRGDYRTRPFPEATSAQSVTVRPLDQWREAVANCPRLVIKIDVQGDEPDVVRGGRAMLTAVPNTIVLFELHPDGLRAAGHDPGRLLADLRALGFTLHGVDDYGQLLPMTTAQADELAARRSGDQFASVVAVRGP